MPSPSPDPRPLGVVSFMPKRFTATEKWDDPWFCALSERDRLFWVFLCDKCDHAGIWQVNRLLVQLYFPNYDLKPERFADRIQVLTPEKWLLTKFVFFQYKQLNPENRAHASVIDKLEKEGAYKGLNRGLQARKVKDMVKDMVKEKEGIERGTKRFVVPTLDQIAEYATEIGFKLNASQFYNYYASKGWKVGNSPMKDWKAAVRTWRAKEMQQEIVAPKQTDRKYIEDRPSEDEIMSGEDFAKIRETLLKPKQNAQT